MPRNKLGQFEPGTCGNPRGRPRKLPRKIRPDQLRRDFFDAGETLVPIIEKGKRKLIPASVAIMGPAPSSGTRVGIIGGRHIHILNRQDCSPSLRNGNEILGPLHNLAILENVHCHYV